jgi:class 3 adenylate cyclase
MGMGMARKLVAIVAADVVGYSRLMGADEAGTLAARDFSDSAVFIKQNKEHGRDNAKPNREACPSHRRLS